MKPAFRYLFGPVPSRRFGRSLGVDVVPLKTCSLNCLFCQLGPTATETAERAEYVPFDAVCAEIEEWLRTDGRADVITLAGSGEPTLYSRLGDLIDFIKTRCGLPVVLLSNGTLFFRPDVRAEAARADIVKTSLCAWDEASFQKVNRPAPGLTFEQLVNGARAFRSAFRGEYRLEVFLLEGINADPDEVRKIAAIAESIRPDRIQLNTATRPAADASALPVEQRKLEALCGLFTPRAEVIASFAPPASGGGEPGTGELVAILRRHPATAAQLSAATGAPAAAIAAALAPLVAAGELRTETRDGDVYYK